MSSDRLGCDLNSYIDFDDGMPRSPFKVWALVWGKCNDPATAVIKKKNLPLHTVKSCRLLPAATERQQQGFPKENSKVKVQVQNRHQP